MYRLIRNSVGRNRSLSSSWMRATTTTTTTTTTSPWNDATGCIPVVTSKSHSTLSMKRINFPWSTTSSWLISNQKPQHWYPRFDSRPPRQPQNQQNQQVRNYLFFPTSWRELQIRDRVVREARIVNVKLWGQRARERILLFKTEKYYKNKMTQARERGRIFRERGVQWLRSKMSSSLLQKLRGRFSYYSSPRPRPLTTIPIPIKEYSKAHWFDRAGRPMTSRDDETGRFVNPWMSQSTDGVHTLETLLRWRWSRFQREWKQYGWDLFLPSFLTKEMLFTTNHYPGQTARVHRRPPVMLPPPLEDPSILRCTWIGHSTCWIQQGQHLNILTDPMFSDRASPSQSMLGVERHVPPAFSISPDLDHVHFDACIISHDHYDHLDYNSIVQLKNKVDLWVVPLGIGTLLQQWANISSERIVELSWWESVLLRRRRRSISGDCGWTVSKRHSLPRQEGFCLHPSVAEPSTMDRFWITALPAQHWSSRTFFDRCRRLWASFAIFLNHEQLFFFAGDTGYPTEFPLFEQISDYLGRPVDMAAIPIGAYEPRFFNREAHLDPYEAVQLHGQLKCQKSLAIHYDTFELGEEPRSEPARLLNRATQNVTAPFLALPHGSSISVGGGDFLEKPSFQTIK